MNEPGTCTIKGWVIRYDKPFRSGKYIFQREACRKMDGHVIPLVWDLNERNTPDAIILGRAELEWRPNEGIYAVCSLNDPEKVKDILREVKANEWAFDFFINCLTKSVISDSIIRDGKIQALGLMPKADDCSVIEEVSVRYPSNRKEKQNG